MHTAHYVLTIGTDPRSVSTVTAVPDTPLSASDLAAVTGTAHFPMPLHLTGDLAAWRPSPLPGDSFDPNPLATAVLTQLGAGRLGMLAGPWAITSIRANRPRGLTTAALATVTTAVLDALASAPLTDTIGPVAP